MASYTETISFPELYPPGPAHEPAPPAQRMALTEVLLNYLLELCDAIGCE
jgi:hypothetical protein